MSVTEKLIEFDARETWLDPEQVWPRPRREQYLLRQDVIKPLSTDRMVWYSLRNEAAVASIHDRAEALGVSDSDEAAQSLHYWNWYIEQDLEVLRRYMRGRRLGGPYWVIAVSLLTSNPVTGEPVSFADPTSYLAAATSQPAQRDPDWQLLGFDVSDGFMLSGLMNCGYEPEEPQDARDRWARHLNQHHLFEDAAIAWQFKQFSDQRVSEHQPFYVYALWLVEKVTRHLR